MDATVWATGDAMRYLLMLLSLMTQAAYAESLNYYVLFTTNISVINKNILISQINPDKFQPFRGKVVLFPANTNYIMTNVEPELAPLAVRQFFNIYQTYEYENKTMILAKDNSQYFDVERDWSKVRISSP